jgi:hypothetical protein
MGLNALLKDGILKDFSILKVDGLYGENTKKAVAEL